MQVLTPSIQTLHMLSTSSGPWLTDAFKIAHSCTAGVVASAVAQNKHLDTPNECALADPVFEHVKVSYRCRSRRLELSPPTMKRESCARSSAVADYSRESSTAYALEGSYTSIYTERLDSERS